MHYTSLKTLIFSLLLAPLSAFADLQPINGELTAEQKAFVSAHAPILIQPEFENKTDNLLPFDFAEASKGKDSDDASFNMANVEAARMNLRVHTRAVVDWDYVEIGGAISLNFMFFRPISWNPNPFGRDRRADTECAVLILKKEKVGPSSVVGFPSQVTAMITNAHGVPLAAACSGEMQRCLIPDFSGDMPMLCGLTKCILNQAKGGEDGRSLDTIDRRTLIISEHHSHALSPVTSVDKVLEDINLKDAVVYYPEGADVAELKKRFAGATLKSYRLRDRELSSILIAHKDQILAPGEMNPQETVTSWAGKNVKLLSGIGTELRTVEKDGNVISTGANGYWGWGVVETVKDGQRVIPKHFKDGPRPHTVALHILTDRVLFGFFDETEIKDGALKPVRNNWMTEVE